MNTYKLSFPRKEERYRASSSLEIVSLFDPSECILERIDVNVVDQHGRELWKNFVFQFVEIGRRIDRSVTRYLNSSRLSDRLGRHVRV